MCYGEGYYIMKVYENVGHEPYYINLTRWFEKQIIPNLTERSLSLTLSHTVIPYEYDKQSTNMYQQKKKCTAASSRPIPVFV